MKRILLFAAVNIAVLAVITAVVEALGLDRYLAAYGMSLGGLLLLSALFGFGGTFISLALSKWMAKLSMGVQVIDQPRTHTERWLLQGMIGALRALERAEGQPLPGQLKAFGIHDGSMRGALSRLFMSHPPLEDRIAALQALG